MEVKPGYKQTEVGVIPEEWSAQTLGELFSFKNGLNKAKEYFGYGTPIVNYMDVYEHSGIYASDIKGKVSVSKQELKAFEVRKGDVFFTRTSETVEEIGITAVILDELDDAVFSGFVLRARPKGDSLEDQFKKYCFTLPIVRNQITSKSTYTTRALTNGRVLSVVSIACPQKPEQRAIAGALSDVDALIGALDRLIAKKHDLKQAAMQQLLTGKTRLPGFSGEWETSTIEEMEKARLLRLSRGKVISKKDIDRVPGDFPIYSSSVKSDGVFGCYSEFMFDEELITWSIDGGGHFFYRPKHKFSVTNVCGYIRAETARISYRFLASELQLLHSKMSFDYTSKAHPSVIRKVYAVPLPPLPEQTAIATVLSDMDAEIAALKARQDKTCALKQGMMQELLTGRTRLV
jgi:type I restriction enzyme S subunit